MKIELEVSEKNEGMASPWWVIVDPKQMMEPSCYTVMIGMVTGPYFSREEAQEYLDNHRYNFSRRAVVYCASGCYSGQYNRAYCKAEREQREKSDKGAV